VIDSRVNGSGWSWRMHTGPSRLHAGVRLISISPVMSAGGLS
jgi:hypothetical protein